MLVRLVSLVLLGLGAYLAIGLVFAVPFVLFGARRVDPAAEHGTLGFRLMILPGVAALWPLLLVRWLSGAQAPPSERGPHRDGGEERR